MPSYKREREIKVQSYPEAVNQLVANVFFLTTQAANGGRNHKTRLVAKDCSQKFGKNHVETFAPVIKQTLIRTL